MKTPKWLEDAIFYEIYPPSYFDSNNDGIGDIEGIIEKLDYIKSLGCNALWLNPIFESPFKDGGYDISDYYKIAPRYGSMEDLERLIEEVHKRGMHILLDLVPCHTSDQHPWFIESSKAEKNEYSDRYIWTDNAYNKPSYLSMVGGMAPRFGTYAISYFHTQPCINYGFLDVNESWQLSIDSDVAIKNRHVLIDIIRFYLKKGIDGFRVDMAACLVKRDNCEIGTMQVWSYIFDIIKSEFPESAFVAEWAQPTRSLKCGFDIDFYLDHGWDGGNGYHHLTRDHDMNMVTYEVYSDVSYFKTESTQTIMPFLNEYMDRYNITKDIGYISFLTNNHDMARLTHFYNEHELRLIYCMLFTMPGVPFLYYGDEIGMRFLPVPTKEGGYDRTGSRTPMQWNHNKNAGFSKADKEDIYLPVDEELDNRTVIDQLADLNSLLNHIKTLIALRNDNPSLRSVNNINIIYASYDKKLFIYQRDEFYFVCNPSVYEEQFSLPEEVEFVYGVGEATSNVIKPSSFAIFKRK